MAFPFRAVRGLLRASKPGEGGATKPVHRSPCVRARQGLWACVPGRRMEGTTNTGLMTIFSFNELARVVDPTRELPADVFETREYMRVFLG